MNGIDVMPSCPESPTPAWLNIGNPLYKEPGNTGAPATLKTGCECRGRCEVGLGLPSCWVPSSLLSPLPELPLTVLFLLLWSESCLGRERSRGSFCADQGLLVSFWGEDSSGEQLVRSRQTGEVNPEDRARFLPRGDDSSGERCVSSLGLPFSWLGQCNREDRALWWSCGGECIATKRCCGTACQLCFCDGDLFPERPFVTTLNLLFSGWRTDLGKNIDGDDGALLRKPSGTSAASLLS